MVRVSGLDPECRRFESYHPYQLQFLQEAPIPTRGRQLAQKKYNAKPEQKKRRAQRNKSRRLMERKGLVHKGDGRDIDHNNHDTSDNSPGNLTVRDKSQRSDGGPGAKMVYRLLKPTKKRKVRK